MRRAIRTLEHRGPDAEAIEVVAGANAILAFRRLAIIDLATGDQPMSTPGGQHIIFNGEVYNYRAIRRAIEAEGVQFRTTSDTEVLLHTLIRWGVPGLARLFGMWGFGYLDVPSAHLLLARDRLGIKPLYYTRCPDGLFFASEPKALLSLPWIRGSLDVEQLAAYFTFRAVPAPATLFTGIKKLPPGTVLHYDLRTHAIRLEPYWEVPPVDGAGSFLGGDTVDRLEAALMEAVRRRLVADVPVGAFLSGGLDSSLVVAAMRRVGHADIQTFSATFPGSRDDESQFARRVARRFRTRHREAPTRPDDFLAALPRWVELNDDLVADASSLPLLAVSRLARAAGCIVLLSGEGADEQFGGYGSYHKFMLLRTLATLVPRRGARATLLRVMQGLRLVQDQDAPRIREYFVERRGYMGTAAVLGRPELAALLVPNGAGAADLPRAAGTTLAELGAFDFRYRIPDDLLMRTDRATMGASVEARVPFLDHEFVELVSRLPRAARAIPGVSKVALRALALRWGVPLATVTHRKIGFQLPIGAWFRGPLRGVWQAVLAERAVPGIEYSTLARMVNAHACGAGQFEEALWRVLALELWYRRWIGGQRAELVLGHESATFVQPVGS